MSSESDYVTFGYLLSLSISIFIHIRQPKLIVARPIHIKRKKEKHACVTVQHSIYFCLTLSKSIKQFHSYSYAITTLTNEKKEKLSYYWNETSAAEDHTYIFRRFSLSFPSSQINLSSSVCMVPAPYSAD